MVKKIQNKYDIGDIVFVNEYNYSENKLGDNHLFVIIDDDNQMIPLYYFGLIVSSNLDKSKNNSKFKYNETINKSNINNLSTDSIVKCDKIFKIPKINIQFKIGTVDIDDFMRFINTYNNFLEQTEKDVIKAN